jgi:hypothetical protein
MATREARVGRRRWRFQFSLRSLFVVMTLVALLLGLHNWQVQRYQQAVHTIQRLQGRMSFGPDSVGSYYTRPLFSEPIVFVDLAGTSAANDDLKRLRSLVDLEQLNLSGTEIRVGGLTPLAGLTNLHALSLNGTAIGDSDLVRFRRLENLAQLDLSGTGVGDAGLKHLASLAALETLYLHGTKATGDGLEPLCGLPRLGELSLDDGQITPAAVARLARMPALKRVLVRVPRGTGKRAWELLSPLAKLRALGFQGDAMPALFMYNAPRGGMARAGGTKIMWVTPGAWDDTNAGVLDSVREMVAIKSEQEAVFLDAIIGSDSSGLWKKGQGREYFSPALVPAAITGAAVPEKDRIGSTDQLMQVLKQHDAPITYDKLGRPGKPAHIDFNRARLFAASNCARSAVPALLKVVNEPKRNNADYELHGKAVFLLVRIAGTDPQVLSALGTILKSKDNRLRVTTFWSFDDEEFDLRYGRIGPRINAAQAEVLVPLLLGCVNDPETDAKNQAVRALGIIVAAHPQNARAVVPVLLRMLENKNLSGVYAVQGALESIATACPEQAAVILAKLLASLESAKVWDDGRKSPSPALSALCLIAPVNRQTATAAVPVLLRVLHEAKGAGWWLNPAFSRIARDYPEQLKTFLPAILAMCEDQDRDRRQMGRAALAAVAAGVWDRKTSAAKGR